MLNKPYLRLLQFAFPYLLRYFVGQTSSFKKKNSWEDLKGLLQSPIGAFIEASLGYFLGFKVEFCEMLPTVF